MRAQTNCLNMSGENNQSEKIQSVQSYCNQKNFSVVLGLISCYSSKTHWMHFSNPWLFVVVLGTGFKFISFHCNLLCWVWWFPLYLFYLKCPQKLSNDRFDIFIILPSSLPTFVFNFPFIFFFILFIILLFFLSFWCCRILNQWNLTHHQLAWLDQHLLHRTTHSKNYVRGEG